MAPATVMKPQSTAGIIKVNPTILQKDAPKVEHSGVRLKLLLRRLPPSLTKDELLTTIGSDWHVGTGKVDWIEFRAGKISRYMVDSHTTRCVKGVIGLIGSLVLARALYKLAPTFTSRVIRIALLSKPCS